MRGAVVVTAVLAAASARATAQEPPAIWRGAPGPEYRAGGFHRFVLGSGYRDLWTTPIEAEVLDLEHFSGGLTARKKGGGKQTKALTLDGEDGRKWKFRSIDKDPSAVLPDALKDSLVDRIAQDQISASLPVNGLVVDRLADAVGLLHVSRRVVALPDSSRLGEFQKEFAGMLGTLEERASVEPPVTAGFEPYRRLVDTEELDKILDADARERVDAYGFLKARLFDMLIGDYDRHEDQWDWAREADAAVWRPLPKDRDLAFVKFDGVLIDAVRSTVPRLVHFEEKYPNIVGLTWQARFLDRRFLAELDWPAWNDAVRELQAKLTDAVIEEAVRRLPPPYRRLEGRKLAATLVVRRQRLGDAARAFYELLAREAEVHGTDEADSLQILRQRDGGVEIVLAGAGGPYFRRLYDPDVTREVRVFLKGGDDRVVSEGSGSPGVKVRVVGGGGNDFLDDSAGGHTRFYDSSGQNEVVKGAGTKQSARPYTPPKDASGDPQRDWGSDHGVLPWVRVGADYGVILGLQFTKTDYGFRKHPYAGRHSVHVDYSTELETGGIRYDYESLRTDNRSRFQVAARISALDVIHFYGFGNETSAAGDDHFYDVRQTQYAFAPAYRLDLSAIDVLVGPVVQYADTRLSDTTLVAQERPYGSLGFGQAGFRMALGLDRRNRKGAPSSGFLVAAEGSVYPPVWSVTDVFGEVHGFAAAYLGAPLPLAPVLALRAGGARVWGVYPFHEAATIGGPDSVRGLRQQRYSGDASLYGNAELRLRLFGREGSLPVAFGVFGLGDAGRVFLADETSDRWHTGVGGGLWMFAVNPAYTATVSFARSEGDTWLYVQAGFAF
jgi:hypothetical protein